MPSLTVALNTLQNFTSLVWRAISLPHQTPAGVMVKVPVPLQPAVAPDTLHMPLICPFCTVPFKVSVFTSAPVLVMVYWNVPFTMPLKFPDIVNDPLSVVDGKVQELLLLVSTKFVVPSDPPAFTVSTVVKVNMLVPELFKVAAQFPLMLPVACEFEPQPASTIPTASTTATPSLFMKETPQLCEFFGAAGGDAGSRLLEDAVFAERERLKNRCPAGFATSLLQV